MRTLYVTATGTDVGKTYTTLRLIEALGKRGIRPGVYKPVETGVAQIPEDAHALLEACRPYNPNFASLTTEDVTAYTFALPAAPFCADEKKIIEPRYLVEKHDWLLKKCDILLVEGAGGLMVPLTQTYMNVHLLKDIEANALLVTHARLGCINDTLLSMLALRQFDIKFEWCVNIREDEKKDFDVVTRPYYDAVFEHWWSVQEGMEAYIERSID